MWQLSFSLFSLSVSVSLSLSFLSLSLSLSLSNLSQMKLSFLFPGVVCDDGCSGGFTGGWI